jgi:hypothetical protein
MKSKTWNHSKKHSCLKVNHTLTVQYHKKTTFNYLKLINLLQSLYKGLSTVISLKKLLQFKFKISILRYKFTSYL